MKNHPPIVALDKKRLAGMAMGVAGALLIGTSAVSAEEADPRIGEKVDRICFAGSINGFSFVDELRNVVILRKGVRDEYMVELFAGCSRSSLRFSQAIALDPHGGSNCLSRGDNIIFYDSPFPDGTPGSYDRCSIGDIYEWHADAEEADEEEPKGE